MRIYNIKFNKNKGNHPIFDNPDEAAKKLADEFKSFNVLNQPLSPIWTIKGNNVDCIFPHWTTATPTDIGRWVLTDDGRVAQVLSFYYGKNNNRTTFKNGNDCRTKMIKVAWGVYYLYPKVDGTVTAVKMIADIEIKKNRVSLTQHKSIMGTKMNKSKKLFAYYFYATGDPITAYLNVRHVKNIKRGLTKRHLIRSALALARDPSIIAEIKKHYIPDKMTEKSFKERIKESLAKQEVDTDLLIEHVKLGLSANTEDIVVEEKIIDKEGNEKTKITTYPNKKKGGIGHKGFIELAANFIKFAEDETDEIGDDKAKIAKSKNAIEAHFSEEPLLPPAKDILDKVNKKVVESAKK